MILRTSILQSNRVSSFIFLNKGINEFMKSLSSSKWSSGKMEFASILISKEFGGASRQLAWLHLSEVCFSSFLVLRSSGFSTTSFFIFGRMSSGGGCWGEFESSENDSYLS